MKTHEESEGNVNVDSLEIYFILIVNIFIFRATFMLIYDYKWKWTATNWNENVFTFFLLLSPSPPFIHLFAKKNEEKSFSTRWQKHSLFWLFIARVMKGARKFALVALVRLKRRDIGVMFHAVAVGEKREARYFSQQLRIIIIAPTTLDEKRRVSYRKIHLHFSRFFLKLF